MAGGGGCSGGGGGRSGNCENYVVADALFAPIVVFVLAMVNVIPIVNEDVGPSRHHIITCASVVQWPNCMSEPHRIKFVHAISYKHSNTLINLIYVYDL